MIIGDKQEVFMYYQKIVGEHLYLSPMNIETEKKILTKWWNEDQEIAFNNGFYAQLLNEDKVEETLRKWNEGPFVFSVVEKGSDAFMGHISLFNIGHQDQYATMGIYIGAPYRHKGYGRAAMTLLVDYIFRSQRFQALHLEVFDFNQRGYGIYQSLGFDECGRWHQSLYHDGTSHDIILMELLREDWMKHRK